jgi:hypothetical protein
MKQRGYKLIIALALITIGASIYLIFRNNFASPIPNPENTNTTTWKILSNDKFGFSIKYPPSININPERQNPPGSIHEYFMENSNENFRLHVIPNSVYTKSEFLKKSETIGDNMFYVLIFPAGLNSGEFTLTKPILYYDIYKNGNEYSFQFNGQSNLTKIQKQILSTLEFKD